ncbi:VacJ family lipoprotein [Rickettsiales bacterium LUAb2]
MFKINLTNIIFTILLVNIYFNCYSFLYAKSYNNSYILAVNDDPDDEFSEFGGEETDTSSVTNNNAYIADPFETINRKSFQFTKYLDDHVIKYIDIGYRSTIPHIIRLGIINFINNLNEPLNGANDVLQFRYYSFLKSTSRLVINTTIGIFGFIDVAGMIGIPLDTNSLGYTLEYYHVTDGFYIFVPVLGPYTLTSGVSYLTESYVYSIGTEKLLNINYLENIGLSAGENFLVYLENRQSLKAASAGSIDEYALLKSAYMQNRAYKLQHLRDTW